MINKVQGGLGASQTVSKSVESLPPVQVVIQSSLSLKDFKRNYPEVKDAKYLHEKYLLPNEILGRDDSPQDMLVKLSKDFENRSSGEDAFAFAQESNHISPARGLFHGDPLDDLARRLKDKSDLRKQNKT